MSYSRDNYLGTVCRYYDPFNTTSHTCLRGERCHYDHLTTHQFDQYLNQQKTKTLRLIAFYFQSGENYYCANIAFWKLITSEPNNAVNNFGLAQSFEALNQCQEAQEYYLNALKIAPNDNRCHSLYAHFLHSKLKNFESAKQYYVTALKLDGNNPFTHCNYGKLLQDTNDFDNAEYHYKKCLSVAPKHRKCLYFVSRFYHKKNDLYESKKYFDTLIEIGSRRVIKCWVDHFDYAFLLKDMKLYDNALTQFKIALNYCGYDYDKADIYYEMGLIYDEYLSDINNARYHFNEASILNHKQYSMFYKEFVEHHKFNSKQKETVKGNTTVTTYQTNNAFNDWTPFEQQISTQCMQHQTDDVRKELTPTQHTTQHIEHKIEINVVDDATEDIKYENHEIEVKPRKNPPQIEFKRFLECNKLSMYYEKFEEKGYDDIRYLEVMEDDNTFITDIGMSKMHLIYFKKQINKFLINKSMFDSWLKSLGDELYSEYSDLFEGRGIFSFESFYRIARNKEGLLAITGNENQFDADLIWDNTPKQARKLQQQREGE